MKDPSEFCELGGCEKKSVHASRTSARADCCNWQFKYLTVRPEPGRRADRGLTTGVSVVRSDLLLGSDYSLF